MTRSARLARAVWALLLAMTLVGGSAAAQTFPQFTGLVIDAANVLPQATRDDLTRKLEALQKDTHRQLVVATIPSLQGYPLDEYGYKLGRAWGVGLRDVNNGAVLFIAPNEPAGHRGPRIEVGRGLEPIVTDALSSVVIRQQMMPKLRANDVPGAMEAGTDALIQQLRASPDEAKARGDAAIAEFNKTHQRSHDGSGGIPIGIIFWLVILGFVAASWLRRGRGDSYHRGGNWPIMLWGLASAFGNDRGGGGGGGWSGGSSDSGGGSDGSWGGGGFTGGGGGDFGGGGASGRLVMHIDHADRARVAAAVTAAEATTDGEVVAIVAAQSDAYHDVALHWAVLALLFVVALLAAVPGHGTTVLDPLSNGWESGWNGGELLTALLVLLALAFLAVHYATKPLRVRMTLTPAATKTRRVRTRAILLFRTAIEARTASATGVLLYLSLAERRAEIVADRAILSRVNPAEWGEAMAALVDGLRDGRPGDGMVAAIERIGRVLAEHFPHTGTDPNELPDRLIEL